jgi:hypothetical protein
MTKNLVLEIIEETDEDSDIRIINIDILWHGKFLCRGTTEELSGVKGSLENIIDEHHGFTESFGNILQSLNNMVIKDMDTLETSISALKEFNDWIEDVKREGGIQ